MAKYIPFVIVLCNFLFGQSSIQVKVLDPLLSNSKISFSEINESKIKVTVLNKNDQSIEGLSKKDFSIIRNGNSTEIISITPLSELSSVKYNVLLCLDNSSSMSNFVDDLLSILDTLISSFSKSANIVVTFFDESKATHQFFYEDEPLKIGCFNKMGKDLDKLRYMCQRYYSSHYMTAKTYLYDQVYSALKLISDSIQSNEDKFFIVLSDGEDNASETNMKTVISQYKEGKVYSIDFSRQYIKNDFLQTLAKISNGEYFKANDAIELARYFKRIAERIIFSGYEITYRELSPPEVSEIEPFHLENEKIKVISRLDIEDVKTREFFPLLNYIFFDKNSSELQDKYVRINKEDVVHFNEKLLPPFQLEVYKNCLNIIGGRLQNFPESKLTLSGCNDNDGTEKNNKSLSIQRAETVKDYLVSVWKINPERIFIKSFNLPQKPSSTKHFNGQEENRRVEINSDDSRIFEPVEIISDSKISKPENLQIPIKYKSTSPIVMWEFNVSQSGKSIYHSDGKGLPPLYIPWNINEALKGKDLDSSEFIFTIKLKDQNGKESENKIKQVPITYITLQRKKIEQLEDKIVEKLSLVLFDFNSSTLSKSNKEILLKAEEAITTFSTLKMNGYTDSIGTEKGNLKLSQQRAANSLKELIKLLKPETTNYSSEGYGEFIPLYDNGSPEGRFYNRTCQLIIETPIKNEY